MTTPATIKRDKATDAKSGEAIAATLLRIDEMVRMSGHGGPPGSGVGLLLETVGAQFLGIPRTAAAPPADLVDETDAHAKAKAEHDANEKAEHDARSKRK